MTIKIANTEDTSIEEISAQLREPRPFPLGMTEFDEWFDRIWSGALIPSEPGSEELLKLSCKLAATDMILHVGGHETHKPDFYFINQLRKVAANQIALNARETLRVKIKELQEKLKGPTSEAG